MPAMSKLPLDMTDQELEDVLRGNLGKTTSWGGGTFMDELNRRRAERQTKTLIRLTWAIVALTIAVAVLTAVLVIRELSI